MSPLLLFQLAGAIAGFIGQCASLYFKFHNKSASPHNVSLPAFKEAVSNHLDTMPIPDPTSRDSRQVQNWPLEKLQSPAQLQAAQLQNDPDKPVGIKEDAIHQTLPTEGAKQCAGLEKDENAIVDSDDFKRIEEGK